MDGQPDSHGAAAFQPGYQDSKRAAAIARAGGRDSCERDEWPDQFGPGRWGGGHNGDEWADFIDASQRRSTGDGEQWSDQRSIVRKPLGWSGARGVNPERSIVAFATRFIWVWSLDPD